MRTLWLSDPLIDRILGAGHDCPNVHTARDISDTAKRFYGHRRGLSARLQVLRPYICPFEELLPLVPSGSAVLDVGCGGGLFLALLHTHRAIARGVGFDVSYPAIALAQEMARDLARPAALEFRQIDTTAAWPEGEFDVVSMIDVLHHVDPAAQLDVLSLATSKVRHGGILLYKDMARVPRWRAWCNQAHDLIMARQWVHLVPFSTVREHLSSIGMAQVVAQSAVRFWYGHEWGVFTRAS